MRQKEEKNIEPGIYKHYKDKLYKVLFTALDSDTKEEKIAYQEMYGNKKVWIRSKSDFISKVDVENKKMPRFSFVKEEKDDFEEKYKRALADYQNLLKRTEKEKQEFMRFSHEQFLHEILPVYDNLKMALTHSNDNNNDSWLEGVKYVVKQFKDVLTNLGVEEIKTIGKKFDHNTMEAMEGKGNIVEREVKPGYMLKGKVIVAAKVILGDGKKSDSDK